MELDVIRVIDQCENCNRNQLAPVISHPAIAIPVINIFDRINIDLVFGLPEVDDYVGIFFGPITDHRFNYFNKKKNK